MTLNSIANSSSAITVDNVSIDGNTITATFGSGDLIIKSDGTNEILFDDGSEINMQIQNDGEVLTTRNPNFISVEATTASQNVTGAGATYTVGFTDPIFDVGGN